MYISEAWISGHDEAIVAHDVSPVQLDPEVFAGRLKLFRAAGVLMSESGWGMCAEK
jgi:hypothetical protein